MLLKWFSRLLHMFVFLVLLYIFSYIFAPILVEASPMTNAFINEVHYDNSGGDLGEYVEIAGDVNIDLTGWSLLLYNGNNGEMYNSFGFDRWSTIDASAQFGFHTIKTTGIQNGSPDGVALFDGFNIIQFLSYEGSFTATSGIAKGLVSTDIGVMEPSNTPIGFSLQLTGKGSNYSDFTWSSPQANTFGAMNVGQQFVKPSVNAITVSEPSSLFPFFLFLISVFILSKRQCY
ncbi:lamin tail domain-containing protein [Candidatus Colwellia aromaticivorans]|uniref:lamin tail domain-containing protein n=1 Tax=Candidatus Colwellia aromaticivorans TaxID=2267621 RepID=UPI000DF3615A|nr:lamin tail domain-containing protein [Candidatus Colwellia aromaticivorans]